MHGQSPDVIAVTSRYLPSALAAHRFPRALNMSTALTALILPGLGDSGPDHWQSHWERRDPTCLRLVQTEWDAPRCSDWVACLDTALIGVRQPVVLIAHSSSCAMVAKWAVSARAGAWRTSRRTE
jgi:hypothetical protein